ncbi:hypothetical protein [Carboxylicivirga sp. N1Y90]|uniref:hypothetical protein n=1 Tax=Carboxylicivirga fragile TaxID=3417571 RepID=UPI003D33E002|nr:hypothetical protein [Marinilabiliaceae bacterium N1Y90]
MKLARIGSSKTYLKALRDLHKHDFIRYDPSYDSNIGSHVSLFTFDHAACSLPWSKVPPSINYINNKQTHTIKEDEKSISNSKNENMKNDQQTTSSILHQTSLPEPAEGQCQTSKNRTSTHLTSLPEPAEGQHQTSTHLTSKHHTSDIEHPYIVDRTSKHPPLSHIQIYFQEKGHPEAEAQRFFNYYESNGWLIGGKSPMKDWKAAARNWILNIKKFEKKSLDTERHALSLPKGSRSTNEVHKKHFQEKHRTPNNRTSLHPTSPPPSSSDYEEPL